MITVTNTDTKEIQEIFKKQKEYKKVLRTTDAKQRKAKLKRLHDIIAKYRERIHQALREDFRKAPAETDLTEIYPTQSEILHSISHLEKWMRPHSVATPITLVGTRSEIRYEPKGTTLIIGPWNYPFHLIMTPLQSAIAAGNTAVLKPSEHTPHTSHLIKEMIAEAFNPEEVAVVEGDHKVASDLLDLPFDHIFFTGSPNVGRIVMEKAAKNLVPVTLELGGKSPVIIDESADLRDAAKKIMWGKLLNCGQTCVAPDYLIIPENLVNNFIAHARTAVYEFYGNDEKNWPANRDYARIINERHFKRIRHLIEDALEKGARIAFGGHLLEEDNFISPTILTEVTEDMEIMQEEIFGPVLPVVTVKSLEEAVDKVEKREKPLALYIFARSRQAVEYLLKHTHAGGTAVNDTIMHLANPNLPFGGVGPSGHGSYHGEFGFKAFSHERAVLHQNTILSIGQAMYPPYQGISGDVIGLITKLY
ncbi:MAG: aldehyde dehydrogenase family protein [Candidatus Hydrogenedentota bacterium]|nr:MAG: aldehyde dehydrogenase family protein [Candidatus Hydrogenedentota bacterium]